MPTFTTQAIAAAVDGRLVGPGDLAHNDTVLFKKAVAAAFGDDPIWAFKVAEVYRRPPKPDAHYDHL